MKATFKTKKKQQKKKIIVTAFAVGAAGILGYFGWQYLKNRKGRTGNKASDLDEVLRTVTNNTSAVTAESPVATNPVVPIPQYPRFNITPKSANASTFPLKKGSKGEQVRQLQEALIAKYGNAILPRYGADGDFGTETVNALKKAGLPTTVTQSTFNVLVQNKESSTTSGSLGQQLFNATSARDFNKVLAILKQMKSTADYSAANEVFKTLRLGGGVRQTIVNGLLNTFTSSEQKEKIKYEFLRMGLEYDGNRWSQSGLDGIPIITVVPTTIWINAIKGVKVPARTVLGKAVNKRLDYTLFQNKGKYFLVQTKCVKHL